MGSFGLYAALSMGFLGSLHCAGMCGPIMLILPFQFLNGWKKVAGIGLYHLGRISVYALMGLVLHSFKSLFLPQWQQYISIALGVSLLLLGIFSFLNNGSRQIKMPWLDFVKRQSGKVLGRPELHLLLAGGILNGLLPCGLVYMALSLATSAATPQAAMLTMYAFGLGTMPMLIAIIVLKGKISMLRMQSIRRFVPVIMLLFGVLFMLRGMNLGIPYLSPQVSMDHHVVKSCCCHK